MLAQQEFEVAIVTAQMACEVLSEQVISRTFRAKGIQYLENAIDEMVPTYNLSNDKVRMLYVSLTEDSIQHEFFWEDYKRMVSLRNKAIHAGGKVQREQAEVGIRAAGHFIAHLTRLMERL